jgi:hypothetical protein
MWRRPLEKSSISGNPQAHPVASGPPRPAQGRTARAGERIRAARDGERREVFD